MGYISEYGAMQEINLHSETRSPVQMHIVEYKGFVASGRDVMENNKEENQYTRPKTVRFTPATFVLIEAAARDNGITTSAYIRNIVGGQVPPLVDLGELE